MRHLLLSVLAYALSSAAGLLPAQAAPVSSPACPDQDELLCILEASWQAGLVLPEAKKARVGEIIYQTAAHLGGAATAQTIGERIGIDTSQPVKAEPDYPDYGWEIAEPILDARGVRGLIADAKNPRASGLFAPADALLSAGKKLHVHAPDDSAKINSALLDLIAGASAFEKPAFAHAAAELAMVRCDRVVFEQAIARTDAPGNMRYAMWRARLTGNALSLLDRIRSDVDDEDTRHVRQVLDGYREIATRGYCPATEE